jgi:hypothetical protein
MKHRVMKEGEAKEKNNEEKRNEVIEAKEWQNKLKKGVQKTKWGQAKLVLIYILLQVLVEH